MTRYRKIKEIIQQNFHKLPDSQQGLAEFFLENFDRIPFLTVQEISDATKYSVASVIRFAQSLGFKGFSAFQKDIAKNLQADLKKGVIFPLLENNSLDEDILTIVANQDISNINNTLTAIERRVFDQFTTKIIESERIFTVGMGISYLLAQILAYQLKLIGKDSYPLSSNPNNFFEQILFMNEKDCLIAFSFPPYSKETISAAKYARSKNIPVLSLTDKEVAPIYFHSLYSLIVKSENRLYTNSFSAISVVINAITTKCASLDKQKAKMMFNEFEKISKIQKDLI